MSGRRGIEMVVLLGQPDREGDAGVVAGRGVDRDEAEVAAVVAPVTVIAVNSGHRSDSTRTGFEAH